uniref:Fatty-acid amide hydrolase 1 n=1 Tax=Paramormyrops kingsleyae TaxID=1676925 RepID=A0A3B3T803_9TELE|nr:fatty-acid amide hydrolase 1 [Paramormyrops kingsleyae]
MMSHMPTVTCESVGPPPERSEELVTGSPLPPRLRAPSSGVGARQDSTVQVIPVHLSRAAMLAAAACGIGAVLLLRGWMDSVRAAKKTRRARIRRDESFGLAEKAVKEFAEQNPGIDSNEVTALSLNELCKQLKDGELSPHAVLHAYIEKALQVSRRLNCSTEFLLESREQLREIETHQDGLLFGIPVSIKDNLNYKGHDSSCGVISKLDQPATADSVLVQVLKRQGAVPFVKTNVPQGLLNYDCSNPIYGQTLNPCNLQKTSGGSSGGEGALIAGGGSILGIGTDIGGSVRIPASFCEICGFKPTSGRLSLRGCASCVRGQKSVLSTAGCLAKDVDGLALCMKALLCEDMYFLDPTVPPVPFKEQVYSSTRPLRIGYYENDGMTLPSPGMSRALREVRELLEKAGHTIVPFTPPRLFYAMHELTIRGILADAGVSLLSNLKGSPIDPCLKDQTNSYKLPLIFRKICSFFLNPLYPRLANAIQGTCGVSSVTDLWKQHADVEDYTHEFIAEWRKLELDVVLCPMLGPAYNFGFCGKLTCASSYTALYNLVNFPAGAVPVSTVTQEDENELKHYKGNFGDIWDKTFKKAVTGGQGLPVAVQCISLPWQDELCLRFMWEIEQLVKQHRNQ